jgi:Kelch motif/Galactose oxidase, central domain
MSFMPHNATKLSHTATHLVQPLTQKIALVTAFTIASCFAADDSAANTAGNSVNAPATTPAATTAIPTPVSWTSVSTTGNPNPRHEAGFITVDNKCYLLGGRGIKPVDIYDPATQTWTSGSPPPMTIHHFQPVVWEGRIWLPGAMTGGFPKETGIPYIPIYDPKNDTWSKGPEVPAERRRGGAGAVIHNGILYIVCGIVNGHWDGNVAWLDAYDLRSGKWHILPDAPRVRDHFQAAVVNNNIYAVGGRKTSAATKETFNLTTSEVDIYSLTTGQWTTLPPEGNIPTPRAGSMTFALGNAVIVVGGESTAQKAAHSEVEALDTNAGKWNKWPPLKEGRHGTGVATFNDLLIIACGSGGRGGGPELSTTETATIGSVNPNK